MWGVKLAAARGIAALRPAAKPQNKALQTDDVAHSGACVRVGGNARGRGRRVYTSHPGAIARYVVRFYSGDSKQALTWTRGLSAQTPFRTGQFGATSRRMETIPLARARAVHPLREPC